MHMVEVVILKDVHSGFSSFFAMTLVLLLQVGHLFSSLKFELPLTGRSWGGSGLQEALCLCPLLGCPGLGRDTG